MTRGQGTKRKIANHSTTSLSVELTVDAIFSDKSEFEESVGISIESQYGMESGVRSEMRSEIEIQRK